MSKTNRKHSMSEACHEAAHAVMAVEVRQYFEQVELLNEYENNLGLRGATHLAHPIHTIEEAQDRIMICKAGYTMDKLMNRGLSYFGHILRRGRRDYASEREWFRWIDQHPDAHYDRFSEEPIHYDETKLDRELQRLTREVLLELRSSVEVVASELLRKRKLHFDEVLSLCGGRPAKLIE